MKDEIYKKIIEKKEFSKLLKEDVEKAFGCFEKRQVSDEEKIRLTRDLLRKVFSAFTSQKILSIKDKDPEWILRKHLSTRERLPYYDKVYKRLLKGFGQVTIIDLGAGINGFSYNYFPKKVEYLGLEAMGQLVDLMNYYFKTKGLNGRAVQTSLFNLENVKKVIKSVKKSLTPNQVGLREGVLRETSKEVTTGSIIFLFKTLDSLEMLEKDYSKILLKEIVPLVNRVVISFATRSLIKKTRFKAKRTWLINFIKDNFEVLEDFELGVERYIVFRSK